MSAIAAQQEACVKGRISGDKGEATHIILTKPVKGGALKELGSEARQAGWDEEGEGCAGQKACGDPASPPSHRSRVGTTDWKAKQAFLGRSTNACLDSFDFAKFFRKTGEATPGPSPRACLCTPAYAPSQLVPGPPRARRCQNGRDAHSNPHPGQHRNRSQIVPKFGVSWRSKQFILKSGSCFCPGCKPFGKTSCSKILSVNGCVPGCNFEPVGANGTLRMALRHAPDPPLSWPHLTRPSNNILKVRCFPWMAASSAAMTAEFSRKREVFFTRLNAGIHGGQKRPGRHMVTIGRCLRARGHRSRRYVSANAFEPVAASPGAAAPAGWLQLPDLGSTGSCWAYGLSIPLSFSIACALALVSAVSTVWPMAASPIAALRPPA
jgi:hypothetical protein